MGWMVIVMAGARDGVAGCERPQRLEAVAYSGLVLDLELVICSPVMALENVVEIRQKFSRAQLHAMVNMSTAPFLQRNQGSLHPGPLNLPVFSLLRLSLHPSAKTTRCTSLVKSTYNTHKPLIINTSVHTIIAGIVTHM